MVTENIDVYRFPATSVSLHLRMRAERQNIYDQPDFFAGRSVGGLDAAAEWPALRAMLPKVCGLTLVDLGCGWFR